MTVDDYEDQGFQILTECLCQRVSAVDIQPTARYTPYDAEVHLPSGILLVEIKARHLTPGQYDRLFMEQKKSNAMLRVAAERSDVIGLRYFNFYSRPHRGRGSALMWRVTEDMPYESRLLTMNRRTSSDISTGSKKVKRVWLMPTEGADRFEFRRTLL